MQQWELKLSSSAQTDNMTYAYMNSNKSNKLQLVTEAAGNTDHKLGDFTDKNTGTGTIDYDYDDNGNLVKDLNKNIGSSTSNGITYNHLNLPEIITIPVKAKAFKTVNQQPPGLFCTDYLSHYDFLDDH